jgi:hypothetical protein
MVTVCSSPVTLDTTCDGGYFYDNPTGSRDGGWDVGWAVGDSLAFTTPAFHVTPDTLGENDET